MTASPADSLRGPTLHRRGHAKGKDPALSPDARISSALPAKPSRRFTSVAPNAERRHRAPLPTGPCASAAMPMTKAPASPPNRRGLPAGRQDRITPPPDRPANASATPMTSPAPVPPRIGQARTDRKAHRRRPQVTQATTATTCHRRRSVAPPAPTTKTTPPPRAFRSSFAPKRLAPRAFAVGPVASVPPPRRFTGVDWHPPLPSARTRVGQRPSVITPVAARSLLCTPQPYPRASTSSCPRHTGRATLRRGHTGGIGPPSAPCDAARPQDLARAERGFLAPRGRRTGSHRTRTPTTVKTSLVALSFPQNLRPRLP